MLSEEEIRIVKALDNWRSGGLPGIVIGEQTSVGEMEPSERTRQIIAEIKSLLTELEGAFENLSSNVTQG